MDSTEYGGEMGAENIQGHAVVIGASIGGLCAARVLSEFFDRVTVNAEEADLRANRLCLLSQIRVGMDAIADFSKIEG